MYFVIVGMLLLLLKWMEVGPVGQWSWGWVLAPFALAIAWWTWADASGYTKRRVAERIHAKREARRQKSLDALGIQERKKRP